MKNIHVLSALLCIACLLSVAPAHAAAPKLVSKHGYWSAFQMMEGENPVCYMSISAKPPEKKGDKKAVKRGDVVLMITHRPNESSNDVISYAAGAKFKPATDVTFKVGAKSFGLFTQGDTAWSRDQATDRAIAEALRGASNVTVSGTFANGQPLADTVSLKGVEEAYAAISKACNVPYSPLKKPAPKTEAPASKTSGKPQKTR